MQRRILTTAALTAAVFPLIRAAQAQGSGDASARAMAIAGGAFSLQTSRLAQTRASAEPVRMFARMEAEEQQSIVEALQLVGVAIPTEVAIDATKAEAMRRLQSAQGADFDRAYLAAQLTGHQELQRLHTTVAAGTAPPPERAISHVAVPAIKTHIAWIEAMQQHRG